MRDQTLKSPDTEICGLIGGRDHTAMSLYQVTNVAEIPERNFLMEPGEQFAAMRAMRNRKEVLWGIYHSHPSTAAVPSQTDRLQAAYPGLYYFIISLRSSREELGSYYFNGEDFIPVDVIVGNM